MDNENKKAVKSVTVKYEPKKKGFGAALKKFFKILAAILLAGLLIVGGLFAGMSFQKNKDEAKVAETAPVIQNTPISQKVVALKELTTAQLTYRGLVEYEEGKVPIINKNVFLMTYTARVTAGVDFSKAIITEKDEVIIIELPTAKVLTKQIDLESIEYHDVKKAKFNPPSREDAIAAQKDAYEDLDISMDKKELLDTANAQAKVMLKEMLEPFLADGVELIVK